MSRGFKEFLLFGVLVYLAAGFYFGAIPSHECTSEQRAADPPYCAPGLGQRVTAMLLWPLNRSDRGGRGLARSYGPFPARKPGMSDRNWKKTVEHWCSQKTATKPENIHQYEQNCLDLPLARSSNAKTAKLPALPALTAGPPEVPPSRAPETSDADWTRNVRAWCQANRKMERRAPNAAKGRAELFYDLNCTAFPHDKKDAPTRPAVMPQDTATSARQLGSATGAERIHFPIRQEGESLDRWHDRIADWCVSHGRKPKAPYAPRAGVTPAPSASAGQNETAKTSSRSLLAQLPDMNLEPPPVRVENLEIVEKYKKAYCQPR